MSDADKEPFLRGARGLDTPTKSRWSRFSRAQQVFYVPHLIAKEGPQ